MSGDDRLHYELRTTKRADIEDIARKVYELLNDPEAWSADMGNAASTGATSGTNNTSAVAPAAMTRLSQMILAPVAGQLGKKRLLIVADGALQYIPFAALPIPTTTAQTAKPQTYQPLIVEHEIVNLPSASTLAVLRNEVKGRQPAPKMLAVLADPVFSRFDERVQTSIAAAAKTTKPPSAANGVSTTRAANNNTEQVAVNTTRGETEAESGLASELVRSAQESGAMRGVLRMPRLPGTRREAEQILKLIPTAANKLAIDFAANRSFVTDAELSRYRYIHLATHGFLNSQHPELSGLALTLYDERGKPVDGFLRAHEVFNLKLPAEMVVLSACQTALGKEVRGEGLVGLTRGFMYAGTPRVVASLWSVSDRATAELMTRFYKGILVGKLPPAQALQAAQVSMLKDKEFASPFFWSAFVLQGEWR